MWAARSVLTSGCGAGVPVTEGACCNSSSEETETGGKHYQGNKETNTLDWGCRLSFWGRLFTSSMA